MKSRIYLILIIAFFTNAYADMTRDVSILWDNQTSNQSKISENITKELLKQLKLEDKSFHQLTYQVMKNSIIEYSIKESVDGKATVSVLIDEKILQKTNATIMNVKSEDENEIRINIALENQKSLIKLFNILDFLNQNNIKLSFKLDNKNAEFVVKNIHQEELFSNIKQRYKINVKKTEQRDVYLIEN